MDTISRDRAEALALPSPLSLTAAVTHPLPEHEQAHLRQVIARAYAGGDLTDMIHAVINAVAEMRLPALVSLDEHDVAVAVLRREWDAALVDEQYDTAMRMRKRVGELEGRLAARSNLSRVS